MGKYKALEVAVHAAPDKQISLTDPRCALHSDDRQGHGAGRLQCAGRRSMRSIT